MDERIRIGQRIAALRKEQGLTQEQLGEMCGIRGNHITRIEKGRYSVGLDTLAAIAKALDKRIDFV
jgi:transcriptional regulator with XRE-family HTH domain